MHVGHLQYKQPGRAILQMDVGIVAPARVFLKDQCLALLQTLAVAHVDYAAPCVLSGSTNYTPK